jgi:hypothetical protein
MSTLTAMHYLAHKQYFHYLNMVDQRFLIEDWPNYDHYQNYTRLSCPIVLHADLKFKSNSSYYIFVSELYLFVDMKVSIYYYSPIGAQTVFIRRVYM